MEINNLNSANFGSLYVKRQVGAVLSDTQNAVRSDVLFDNHKHPRTYKKQYLGVDIYDREKKHNKDILKIIAERLDAEGKDVFVIFTKRDKVFVQIRAKNAKNNDCEPYGAILNQKCVLYQFMEGPLVAESTYDKICNFLIGNIGKNKVKSFEAMKV